MLTTPTTGYCDLITYPSPLRLPVPNLMDPVTAVSPTDMPYTCVDKTQLQPARFPVYYSPSIYSTPSCRNSTITLFEEDTQLVGLSL
jgi:hypothetical protein